MSFDHESFAVLGLLALFGTTFYLVLVHRLVIYAPHFLPKLGHLYAVALHFARCGQLAAELAPIGALTSCAHRKKRPPRRSFLFTSC